MIFWALKKSLKDYSFLSFRNDVLAGFIVSLLALPLSMALSIAVGLPPQHGLYTAIVAGIITPLLGGSIYQVSGPTAAFIVILAPIVSTHGYRGLLLVTVMAGLLLIIAGLLKVGRYARYIPYPVTTGFTTGIALVVAILSLKDFLGLRIPHLPENFFQKITIISQHLPKLNYAEFSIGIVSFLFMLIPKRFSKFIPTSLIGILVGTLISLALAHYGFTVDTIANRFHYTLPNGSIGYGVPPFLPSFEFFGFSKLDLFAFPSFHELQPLFIPSLVVAALAALESILSASVADGISGTKHNPNAELLGIGIGNILTGLASGIPATGAIARTATNLQSGAKSPIASSLHGLFILVYVLLLAPLISYLPMASISALLLITAYRMSHIPQFIRVVKFGLIEDSRSGPEKVDHFSLLPSNKSVTCSISRVLPSIAREA